MRRVGRNLGVATSPVDVVTNLVISDAGKDEAVSVAIFEGDEFPDFV
jgi:hypothetical protein